MPLTYSFPGPTGLATTTDGRKDFAGMIYRDTTGAARAGVFPRTPAPLVTSRADMSVNVAAFEGAAVQFGGPILLANDGTAQVALAAAPASNSRIDVIYAKQNESAAPATDADNNRVLGVVAGLSASNPIKPALPPGALELATVVVPAGVAATNASGVTITATNQFTTMTGGLLWVRNSVELAALTNVPMGQHVLQMSDSSEWVYGPTGFAQGGSPQLLATPFWRGVPTVMETLRATDYPLIGFNQTVVCTAKTFIDWEINMLNANSGYANLNAYASLWIDGVKNVDSERYCTLNSGWAGSLVGTLLLATTPGQHTISMQARSGTASAISVRNGSMRIYAVS